MPGGERSRSGTLMLTVWVGYFATLQWSVVRYRFAIVGVLTLATVFLGIALVGRWRVRMSAHHLAATALLMGLSAELVPFFSYTTPTSQRWLAHGLLLTSVLTAVATASASPGALRVGAMVAGVGTLVTGVAVVVLDPAPRIDVWVTLQQASDGLARGQNMYEMVWRNSPGIKDAFTYLPWTAVLVAPGRWLFGDVRWALLGFFVLGVLLMAAVGHRTAREPSRSVGWSAPHLTAVILLTLAPGTLTQFEQAWTEPLLFALLAAWALLIRRGHAWWAVVPLALACASKQHMALLLPILACWPQFGLRRTTATAGLTGGLLLPWFLASPSAFVHDTITLLIGFHPIKFANTLFIASQTELGWTPPFWLTGAFTLGALTLASVTVRRRHPDLAELLRWLALVLLVANLVNKQAFYNQYWLVGALVALSVAAEPQTAELAFRPSRRRRLTLPADRPTAA